MNMEASPVRSSILAKQCENQESGKFDCAKGIEEVGVFSTS